AVLASVGAVSPMVYKQPKVSVISTGDELVEPGGLPAPAMIRNSNSSQLMAQVEQIHLKAMDLGISGDAKEELQQKIQEGLARSDVVIVSGGVSMGEYDYVPAVMQKSGVEILFKSIAIQPGRPTVFGRKRDKFTFGLPGNPVSSFVLFELLVKPFLFKWMGHDYRAPSTRLPMGKTYTREKSFRKSILPVTIREHRVYPVDYHGSAHIHAYIHADGMVAIEPGVTKLNKGEAVDVRLL
ncbi:MAG: molybdopterin molybdotransferase MoeA, partial [Bacteroidota bacterium]